MTGKHDTSTEQARPTTTAGAWGLRLFMGKGGKNEVKEFTGMWRLQPEADQFVLSIRARA
jgi:hypothetical protein